jgi:hypothetical protein
MAQGGKEKTNTDWTLYARDHTRLSTILPYLIFNSPGKIGIALCILERGKLKPR